MDLEKEDYNMAKIGDVGTMRELDVKPGDVVCLDKSPVSWVEDGREYTCHDKSTYGRDTSIKPQSWVENADGGWVRLDCQWKFRLISRDTTQPTIWRDMTDAEKGALLLAKHEGKVIECIGYGRDFWLSCEPQWKSDWDYRIKPEPVRETVTMFIKVSDDEDTPIGTIDLIDGKPVIDSVKMEEF